MLRHFKIAAAASALALLICNPAWAENRVALVIGNSAYRAVSPLPNAVNDAAKMTDMLSNAGFEVLSTPDLSQYDLRKTISEFAGKVAEKGPDTVALVFYAGHGIQVDGENFLVPVDVDPKREADIPVQAVRLNDILNALTSVPNKMRIVMLDACRNNPFPAISQTTGKGLALVDTKSGSPGTFISYSTSPGSEAEDGTGANSPYTTALLNVAKEPGLSIEEAFKRVRVSVNEATQGRQVPWESSSLTSDFRFVVKADAGSADTAQPAASGAPVSSIAPRVTRSVDEWKKDLQGKEPKIAYDLVIADDTVEGYEAYVALFAQPPLGTRVKLLLERRKEMIAWDNAVIINTGASYRTFAVNFPGSDLVATARKLEERMRNRSLNANAAMLPAPVVNATPVPTNVALAPATCPCNAAPTQKAEPKQVPKRAEPKARNRRVDAPPPRRPRIVEEEEVIVYRRPPPPPVYVGPGPYYGGGGISIGGGGFRPGGSGGYGPRPAPMQSAPPMTGRPVYR